MAIVLPPADAVFYREQNAHAAFAVSRSDLVCERVFADALRAMDDYCDSPVGEESRAPLVVEGSAGSGRSALLAYWARRRVASEAQRRTGEVVVLHHAGCSRDSVRVSAATGSGGP